MALIKLTYVDYVTTIPADNLNDIQDEIIANAEAISGKQDDFSDLIVSANNGKVLAITNGELSAVPVEDLIPDGDESSY